MSNYKDKVMRTSLKNRARIDRICKPLLDHFDLSYFYYFKVTNNGDYGFFGNQIDWNEYFANKKLFQNCAYYFKPCNYNKGPIVSIIPNENEFSEVNNIAKAQFDLNYVLEIGCRNDKGIEFFGFGKNSKKRLTYLSILTK